MPQAAQKKPREKDPRKEELDELRAHIRAMKGLLKELSDHTPGKLARVKKMVASVPEGAELLKLASKTKTRIGFGKDMKVRLAGLTETLSGRFNYSVKKGLRISGKPRYRVTLDAQMTEHELAVTLAHELRHVWQNVQLDKHRAVAGSPTHMVTVSRLAEGDARAFEAYFEQRLDEKLQEKPEKEFSVAKWKRAFLAFQKNKALSGSYDSGVVDSMGPAIRKLTKIEPDAKKLKKMLSGIFNPAAERDLKDATKILRAGLSKTAKPYMTFKNTKQVTRKITGYAKPTTRKKLRQMEKIIKTGKV